MSFTTQQAGKALCLTPNNMRKYRFNHGLGKPMGAGNLVIWTLEELKEIQRLQGTRWTLPRWEIKFLIPQLEGADIAGSMNIWAEDDTIAKSKAMAWFWNALLKEEPGKWGVPVSFVATSVQETSLGTKPQIERKTDVITFNNL